MSKGLCSEQGCVSRTMWPVNMWPLPCIWHLRKRKRKFSRRRPGAPPGRTPNTKCPVYTHNQGVGEVAYSSRRIFNPSKGVLDIVSCLPGRGCRGVTNKFSLIGKPLNLQYGTI
jgi:hypothetical protein